MNNILIYFDHPINPTQGGTERTAFLLACLLKKQGFHVVFLSLLHTRKRNDSLFPQYFLPDPLNLFSSSNSDFVEKICGNLNIGFILNEGASSDSSFFFNHACLKTNAQIVSILNFSIWEGLDHFHSLIPPMFGHGQTWPNMLKTAGRMLTAPWKKYSSIRKKRNKLHHLLEYSDKVVVLSPSYASDCISFTAPRYSHKLHPIPNPLTFPVQEPFSLELKKNTLLYVGRLSYGDKRVDRLLNIWKKLHATHADWCLKIVGDGEFREPLEKMAARDHLERVFFMGRQDPEPFYREAKILCMTSTHEGMPMVINEALAYGCLPIAFNSFHAAEEMIPNEETGRLVPAFDLEQYARTLAELMKTPYQAPCRKVLENYSEKTVTSKWLSCLKEQS